MRFSVFFVLPVLSYQNACYGCKKCRKSNLIRIFFDGRNFQRQCANVIDTTWARISFFTCKNFNAMTLCHTGLKWHKRVNEDRIVIFLSWMLWIDCYWLLLPCAEWWDLQWALGLQAAAPAPSDWETLQRRRSSPVIVVSPLALPREQTVCSGSSRPAASPTSGPEPWNHTYNMHTHSIQYITIFIHFPSIFRGSNVIGQVNIIIDKLIFFCESFASGDCLKSELMDISRDWFLLCDVCQVFVAADFSCYVFVALSVFSFVFSEWNADQSYWV